VSQQIYAILEKIRNVDLLLRYSPSLVDSVREIHPDMCFYFGRIEAYALSEEIRLWVLERYRLVEKVFGTAAKKTHSCLNPLVGLTKDIKNRARKIDRQELMSDVG